MLFLGLSYSESLPSLVSQVPYTSQPKQYSIPSFFSNTSLPLCSLPPRCSHLGLCFFLQSSRLEPRIPSLSCSLIPSPFPAVPLLHPSHIPRRSLALSTCSLFSAFCLDLPPALGPSDPRSPCPQTGASGQSAPGNLMSLPPLFAPPPCQPAHVSPHFTPKPLRPRPRH